MGFSGFKASLTGRVTARITAAPAARRPIPEPARGRTTWPRRILSWDGGLSGIPFRVLGFRLPALPRFRLGLLRREAGDLAGHEHAASSVKFLEAGLGSQELHDLLFVRFLVENDGYRLVSFGHDGFGHTGGKRLIQYVTGILSGLPVCQFILFWDKVGGAAAAVLPSRRTCPTPFPGK